MAAHHRRRDKSGHVDPFFDRRRRYDVVLQSLGLAEAFATMPRYVREQFWQHKFPDPVLEFDATFPTDPVHRALRHTMESNFRGAVMESGGAAIGVRDYLSVLAGLWFTVRGAREEPGIPPACAHFLREARPVLDAVFDPKAPDAWPAIHAAVVVPLVAFSRLESRMLTVTCRQDFTPNGKSGIRLVAGAAEPQARRITLDGAARPMLRVGTSNAWDGVGWLSWDERQLGRPVAQPLPVYVQSHALRHLHQRVNLPPMARYLESWLHESLKHAVVVERQGPDLLVEFRIREHRLGYLVVTPLDDCVAVRTFKFLTMEGTPEARLLVKRLRLTRRDVDWLRLHELTSFTRTDLRDDAVLRPLLEACGCGHLFDLDEDDYAPAPKAFADEVRRYLRLAA